MSNDTAVQRVRLDALLASRGITKSRTAASALVRAGRVRVNGEVVRKSAAQVAEDVVVDASPADQWVSRAALKLVRALEAFDVDPKGAVVVDVGASTGGFTQVLLERGARTVIALDVGHDQLDPAVASDPRVVSVEGVNARMLTPEQFTRFHPDAADASLIVGDLSFISLRLVLPALSASVPMASDMILLVKPQFEVGRAGVRQGIVRDRALRTSAVMGVLEAARDVGFGVAGFTASPILGTHGNHEYLLHVRRGDGADPTEWNERVERLTGGAD